MMKCVQVVSENPHLMGLLFPEDYICTYLKLKCLINHSSYIHKISYDFGHFPVWFFIPLFSIFLTFSSNFEQFLCFFSTESFLPFILPFHIFQNWIFHNKTPAQIISGILHILIHNTCLTIENERNQIDQAFSQQINISIIECMLKLFLFFCIF